MEVSHIPYRKHVFADLRAYLCVNIDCPDVSFPDSGRWVEHEFDAHQRAWKCNRCSKTYTTRGQFLDHMASRHSNSLSENQLSELAEICWFQRPQIPADDCPFCDEWAVRLREVNDHVSHDHPVLVSKKQYRRHVGTHMEQLALFAIGPSQADGSEAASESNKIVGGADQFQATRSYGDSILEMESINQIGVSSESDLQRDAPAAPDDRLPDPKSSISELKPRFACPYWRKIILNGNQEWPKVRSCCKAPGFENVSRVK